MSRRIVTVVLAGVVSVATVAYLAYASGSNPSVHRNPSAGHSSPSARAEEPAREVAGDGPPFDWSQAFGGGGGQRFSSVAGAQQQATFALRSPKGFTPSDIEVAPTGFAVGWAFDLPAFGGWVHLVESKATTSAQAYSEQFKHANVASPAFVQTTVNQGRLPAVLATANGLGRIMWSDGAVHFDLAGEGLTPAQAAALVEQMLY